jgi:hypothetical protein
MFLCGNVLTSDILIDNLGYYSAAFDNDSNGVVNSSGNSFYDPVKDVMVDRPDYTPPQKDPQGDPQSDTQNKTHTEQLADYLRESKKTKGVNELGQARIFFDLAYTNTTGEEYMSKIAAGVREENPSWFKQHYPGRTSIRILLPKLDGLNKNYNL